MLPRNYDINKNAYSSAMNGSNAGSDYYCEESLRANTVEENRSKWNNQYESQNQNPWKKESEFYNEYDCIPNMVGSQQDFITAEDEEILGYNEVISTDLVTIKSSKPKIVAITNTACEARIDEVKVITTKLPGGVSTDKCIIQGSLIFTISYLAEGRGYQKSEVRFLIPFSNYKELPENSNFDYKVKLDVEDAYAKSIDGRNLIVSAVILTSIYGTS